jgi:hypothetical protein
MDEQMLVRGAGNARNRWQKRSQRCILQPRTIDHFSDARQLGLT